MQKTKLGDRMINETTSSVDFEPFFNFLEARDKLLAQGSSLMNRSDATVFGNVVVIEAWRRVVRPGSGSGED